MTNSASNPLGPLGNPSVSDPKRLGNDGAQQAREQGAPESTSPSFQVLLERLQSKARELEETSQNLEDPAELADAVENARASLEDASTLSERLLEAYREARTHDDASNPDAETGAANKEERT